MTEFLLRYGYLLLFANVFAEQMGLPIPATPVLLAAGALAGAGKLNLAAVMVLAVVASVLADTFWFRLGVQRGSAILNTLCRISLEPDNCVKQTETSYSRYGVASLLFAKFVPGLSTVAPPMAGIFRVTLPRFILFDGVGSAIWAGAFVFGGWLFRAQLERSAEYLSRFGIWVLVTLIGALALYIGVKYWQRRRVFRELRIARITPVELKERMDSGEDVVVVDLRHSLEWDMGKIPGALQISGDELESRATELLAHSELILYCS